METRSLAFNSEPCADIDPLKASAISLFQSKQWLPALSGFDQLLAKNPSSAEIHNYRARTLDAMGRPADALACIETALRINPDNVADLRNKGVILAKLDRFEEALVVFEELLTRKSDDIDILVRRGLVLMQLDRREDALGSIERAVALRPGDPDILNSRVIVLDALGRYSDALSQLDRMLEIKPDHIDAVNNAGMILARVGRYRDSLACYNRSLALKAEQPQAIYNRSLIRLCLGDWIRGFREFESRWDTPPLSRARITGLGPLWLGGDEDIKGKTILLYHEQGFGDSLQFVRYATPLAERGAIVIVAVPSGLAALFRTVPGVANVVQGDVAFPLHDFQCPLMSLPFAFRTTPDTIPSRTPYLFADPVKVATWRARLPSAPGPKIGLVWSGRQYAPINYPRDLPFDSLLPLFDLDAHFVSLQKDMSPDDRCWFERGPNRSHVGDELEDFADTAAVIESLDLVIAADTSVAHLAGALGKPVWLLNRFASCWRWMQSGDNSAWYPSMRQFRQSTLGDWARVIADVKEALEKYIVDYSDPASVYELAPETARPRQGPPIRITSPREKIRLISASRLSQEEFLKNSPLGRSLPAYQRFPKNQLIELRLFPNNSSGLSELYNTALEEARDDPAILVFIHDDVFLSDYYWAQHLHDALSHFDIVGLAGNRRRAPRQASWMYLDEYFTRDSPEHLSGVVGHGKPFPDLTQLSVYGEPGQAVKLLDGVLLAARSSRLLETGLRFDPQFTFDFYDMDFCRQAEKRHLRLGTWPISVVHASVGAFGLDGWRKAYGNYLAKYDET